MIRKVITLLSLCCVVLCAFVGFVSYQTIQEEEKSLAPPIETSCESLLTSIPSETTRLIMTEFVPGKHRIELDFDEDGNFDALCVPFFPRTAQKKIGHGYSAVLIQFNGVPNREALNKLLEDSAAGLDLNYWPQRQQLDTTIHSLLAQKYTNLDFSHSPVAHFGFEATNPLLGETSLQISVAVGSLAILIAILTFLFGLAMRKRPPRPDVPDEEPNDAPLTNRAGLPINENKSGHETKEPKSIFDHATSLRN